MKRIGAGITGLLAVLAFVVASASAADQGSHKDSGKSGQARGDHQDRQGSGARRGGPLMAALDANHDGELSKQEIDNAITVLRSFDRDGDGKVTRNEMLPRLDAVAARDDQQQDSERRFAREPDDQQRGDRDRGDQQRGDQQRGDRDRGDQGRDDRGRDADDQQADDAGRDRQDDAGREAQSSQGQQGTFVRSSDGRITVVTPVGTTMALQLADDAEVTIDGESGSLEDLNRGDKLQYTVGGNQITGISATRMIPQNLTGKFISAAEGGRFVVEASDGTRYTLGVSGDDQVKINENSASVEELQAGDEVRVRRQGGRTIVSATRAGAQADELQRDDGDDADAQRDQDRDNQRDQDRDNQRDQDRDSDQDDDN